MKTIYCGKNLTRAQALKKFRAKYKKDMRGFTYSPKTGYGKGG